MAPVKIAGIRAIRDALTLLGDKATPLPDRAALYAALYDLQLEINRGIRGPKGELSYALYRDGIRQLGRLRLKRVARKVVWRINEEPAWTDPEHQEALAQLQRDPVTRAFIRSVPGHRELIPTALAAALAGKLGVDGVDSAALLSAARQLWADARRLRWRVELEAEETIEVQDKPIDGPEAKA